LSPFVGVPASAERVYPKELPDQAFQPTFFGRLNTGSSRFPVFQTVQRTNVHNNISKRALGHEFQIVPAGNAELNGKLLKLMRRCGLDNPEESVFESIRLIAITSLAVSRLLTGQSCRLCAP
jgi:hypothetical protein